MISVVGKETISSTTNILKPAVDVDGADHINITNSPDEDCDSTPSYFLERETFVKTVKDFVDKKVKLNERDLELFLVVIDKYQERPQLLDPYLEEIIQPIINGFLKVILLFRGLDTDEAAKTKVHDAVKAEIGELQPLFLIIYRLCKTRGQKVIVKFFSHEVSHLEPALEFFNFVSTDLAFKKYWEMRFIMLLWMSLLCMIPFDLKKIDSHKINGETPLVERVLDIVKSFITSVGKEYEGASMLGMRLLTRKDVCDVYLAPFLSWQVETIMNASNAFELRGHLRCLSGLFKYGPREVLNPLVSLVTPCLDLISSKQFKNNSLLRKLLIKLAQRLALCSLKVRIASWRYQRGPRVLLDNLLQSDHVAAEPNEENEDGQEDGDSQELSEDIEHVLGMLLDHLGDKDTIVRWISAKGIGRICNRLDFEMADDVVSSVIESLKEDIDVADGEDIEKVDVSVANDCNWHGSCLAIAELTRRGLLLPDRLVECIPWIIRGLTFEQRKGTYALGTNVRDSACYVLWSVARAYESKVVESFSSKLADALVVVSLTDREVSIRRAASAAFQENAGRHGLFPHGIDIITNADYFAIGNRVTCFVEIAPMIAEFDEYRLPIINHILQVSVSHWDLSIRQLASKSLGILSERFPNEFFCSFAIPQLIESMLNSESHLHGSLLAVGEIVKGLSKSGWKFSSELVKSVCLLLSSLDSKLFEGFGSDLIRNGACYFIACVAPIFLHMLPEIELNPVLDRWWNIINTTLSRSEEIIVDLAAKALYVFLDSPAVVFNNGMLEKYVENTRFVKDKHLKRGYAIALGSLPNKVLLPNLNAVTDALIDATMLQANVNYNDAEARRNAYLSLIKILDQSCSYVVNEHQIIFVKLLSTFLLGMKDYSVDSRGDVGSWIRDASARGIQLCYRLSAYYQLSIEDAIRLEMIDSIILSCFEKIDRIRESAGAILTNLLNDREIELPYRAQLSIIISDASSINWLNSGEVIPLMTRLLHIPVFRKTTLTGLVLNIGGLTESLVRHSTDSFSDFVGRLPFSLDDSFSSTTSNDIVSSLRDVFKDNLGLDRVSIPLLETLDIYLSLGFLSAVSDEQTVAEVFNLVKKEVFKSKNTKKLLVGIKVFTGFASLDTEEFAIQRLATEKLVLYLAHPYPIIRTSASESLYLLISTSFPLIYNHEKLSIAEEKLLNFKWDSSLADCKDARDVIKYTLE